MAERPSWDEYFLQITATRSSYKRLKVGCLVVKNNRMKQIVLVGINSIKYISDYTNDPLVGDLANEANVTIIKI